MIPNIYKISQWVFPWLEIYNYHTSKLQLLDKYFAKKNRQLGKSHIRRHLIVAGWSMDVSEERNNESPCQESALFIDNKASERATWRCDEGKYSASISVRGCLSILDEYKVLRFRLPPSPSRRNKFALARVKRGESPRSAGERADRREMVRGCGEKVRVVGRAGGWEKRRRKNTRGNGRGEREEASEKPGRATPDCDGNFRNYPTSSARHFLPPSRTFPPLIRSPPSALPAALRRAAAHEYQRQSAMKTRACTSICVGFT